MFIDMLLFMFLAYRYKSAEAVPEEEHHLINDNKEINGLDNTAFDKDNKNL